MEPRFDDIFSNPEGEDESTDRTLYIRETPTGDRIDFEIVERVRFTNLYPETTKEMRYKAPLACGHLVDKQNPFGGYCQNKLGLPFRKRTCGREYCARCQVVCARCNVAVSNCCSVPIEAVLHCKRCGKKLKWRQRANSILNFLAAPFLSEPAVDD